MAVVTGDTKVVDAGHGDQVYVNTAGVGLIPAGVDIRPQRAAVGDVVIVSGAIGVHGIAIMSVREGLEFGTEIRTDSAALHPLVAAMLAVTKDLHALRDPTRGGLATSLNEIASTAGVGVRLVEKAIPVPAEVGNACALLGLDPMYVANEGKLVAFVPRARRRCGAGGDARAPAGRRGGDHRRVRRRASPAWWWPGRPSAAPGWWTPRSASSLPTDLLTIATRDQVAAARTDASRRGGTPR